MLRMDKYICNNALYPVTKWIDLPCENGFLGAMSKMGLIDIFLPCGNGFLVPCLNGL